MARARETSTKQLTRAFQIRRLVEESGGGSDDWKVYFNVSPYRRTLETLKGLGRAIEPERIAGVREEPRIREQDFGNFQDREKMRVEREARRRYGQFFYRFLNGESVADVYDPHHSLVVHHTVEELKEFGLTEEMLKDQMWQKTAKPGELNYNFMRNGQSFFWHLAR